MTSTTRIERLSDFSRRPEQPWQWLVRGQADIMPAGDSLLFINQKTDPSQTRYYTNAQLDDYQGRPRSQFRWRPPLEMTVQARFSHPAGQLQGTAGFGFWNDPFMMTEARWPSLPRAVWFFYSSPPSNMKLDLTMPGFGWKAATIDAWQALFFGLLPLAPFGIPLMKIDRLYRLLWPLGQRALQVSEAMVPVDMTAWHTYRLTWLPDQVKFEVDGQRVLESARAPRGPLGFVLWLDNQYMIITPWGRFGHGILPNKQKQFLELNFLSIASSPDLT